MVRERLSLPIVSEVTMLLSTYIVFLDHPFERFRHGFERIAARAGSDRAKYIVNSHRPYIQGLFIRFE